MIINGSVCFWRCRFNSLRGFRVHSLWPKLLVRLLADFSAVGSNHSQVRVLFRLSFGLIRFKYLLLLAQLTLESGRKWPQKLTIYLLSGVQCCGVGDVKPALFSLRFTRFYTSGEAEDYWRTLSDKLYPFNVSNIVLSERRHEAATATQ